jgi:hypothetical protein
MARCPGRARHWYTIWHTIGLRSPVCTHCGLPNPRPLTDQEWAGLAGYRNTGGRLGTLAEAALQKHEEGRPGG